MSPLLLGSQQYSGPFRPCDPGFLDCTYLDLKFLSILEKKISLFYLEED